MVTAKAVPLRKKAWANIAKFQSLRNVSDEEMSVLLGVEIKPKRKNGYLSVDELEIIANRLGVSPERLFED